MAQVAQRKSSVDVVLTNWKRPENIPQIISSFRAQTIPCRITVCDASEGTNRLTEAVLALADRSYRFDHNHGCFNRYIPSFAYDCDYCWFHDDDMAAGPKLLEYMLAWTSIPFSILGQAGRTIDQEQYLEVLPGDQPMQVSFVCRGYLIATKHLPFICIFANKLKLQRDLILDDDILAAAAISAYTGRNPWITPLPRKEEQMNFEELPADHAVWKMPGHFSRRTEFFRDCATLAQSVRSGSSPFKPGFTPTESQESQPQPPI